LIDKHADVAGLQLHYVEAGDGPPVVLLHGFPEFWFSWRNQIPFLAANGFRAIAPDLRGYNDSGKPADINAYAIPEIVKDIAGLITQVAGGRCTLVGHDWGGVAAWFVAMLHPELVERLIILNSPHPAPFAREMKKPRQKLRMSYQLLFQPRGFAEFVMRRFRFLALRSMLRSAGRFTPEDIERYVEAWSKPGALSGMANYYRAVFKTRRLLRSLVRPIAMPTMLIWGDRDPVFTIETTERFEEWVPNLRLERIAKAGHFVQTDAPDRVSQLMVEFLKPLSSRA
jgi:pimeloyl-ACP methyl ester carboxylesterase